jgi:hypothetical protein
VNGCNETLAREGYDTCFRCASMEEKRVQRKTKRKKLINIEEQDMVQDVVCETMKK